jgi:hypothetical protein
MIIEWLVWIAWIAFTCLPLLLLPVWFVRDMTYRRHGGRGSLRFEFLLIAGVALLYLYIRPSVTQSVDSLAAAVVPLILGWQFIRWLVRLKYPLPGLHRRSPFALWN